MKFGDDYAENVKVIVKKGLTAPFLIGEEFITNEFGTYKVDKAQKLIIFDK